MKINDILSYDYISFDVFDTLVRRIVYCPQQIFVLMKSKNNLPFNFEELRNNAEIEASRENVFYNIYDIYKHIPFEDDTERQKAIECEINAEIEMCVPNPEIMEVYNRCITAGKHVILTSDMYLPKHLLIRILESCGIDKYDRLFISCDEQADKCRGELFCKVLNELNCKKKEIVHIGDNFKSDFLQPKKKGIDSILYKIKKNDIYTDKKNKNNVYLNQQTFIDAMISLKYVNKIGNTPFRLGYMCLGPLLYGFSKWLDEQITNDSIDKILFLSRDGKIMMDAYRLVNEKRENHYFYASRKALIIPTIYKHAELNEVIKIFYKTNEDTVSDLLGKLGISIDDNKELIEEYNLNLQEKINYENIDSGELSLFYERIKDTVIENSKLQSKYLMAYLKELNVVGNVAIVDIGWFGNMQKALEELLIENDFETNLRGYYLGVDPNSKVVEENNLLVNGFLFKKGETELRKYEKSINAIIEYMFSTDHGSVIGYYMEEEQIKPKCALYEYSENVIYGGVEQLIDEANTLREIQDAALMYVKDMTEHKLFGSQVFNASTCFANMIQLGNNPTTRDLNYLGDIRFLNYGDKYSYFAKPKKKISIGDMIDEFRTCGWRIGYLKRKFGFPIPYAKIYFIVRKLAGKLD